MKLFILALTLLAPLLQSGSAYALKVSSSGSSFTLNEGASQVIQLQLNAPIICPGGSPTCEVDINFTSSDPAHVSFSPSTVVFPAAQWSQIKSTTINTVDDGIYNSGESIPFSSVVVSNAAYYSGFTSNYDLTLNNIDPLPPLPDVVDKTVSLSKNTNTTVDVLSGISGNPDSSTLSIVSGPSHGVAVDPPGTITYTPNDNYSGPDSLVYSVCSLYGPSVCATANINFNVVGSSQNVTSVDAPSTGFGSPKDNPYGFIVASSLLLPACAVIYSARKLIRAKN